ncbi:lysozyme inhibitor [Luteibacter pinisoli]|uniref:Lysozyme inhibitor n=1 Tax=Luteibacter pinisoli TaxID=2589080 RepID=A0A4Y5YZY1_9GAMM|nr:MliC family protein [Luteibacter pinisoli]QDE37898.1 lysozyme inhibitor [Luteibacter pinisoli]
MKAVLALVLLLLPTPPLAAQTLAIPQVNTGRPIVATYRCPTGKPFKVTYWNGDNGQSFALVPIAGKPLLLVNLMSADGARYGAGSVVWWTKGRNADLYNEGMDPDTGKVRPVSCSEVPGTG